MIEEETLGPEEFYDSMAPYYDSFIERTRLSILSLEEEREFVAAFIRDGTRILDLGCGTGRTMKILAKVGRELVGVDISSRMTEIARNEGLSVVQASALCLPFGEGSFDAVFSIHGGFGYCRNSDEVERLSVELFRVLRKGGVVLLDTPHGRVRGEQFLVSWPAGDRTIRMIGFGVTEDGVWPAFHRAGFTGVRFFGDYRASAGLRSDSRRIIVSATKEN